MNAAHFTLKACAGSSQGLLGYSLSRVEPGDELRILKGGKVPFILRPKAMTMVDTNLETGEASALPVDVGVPTYELIGAAFVLGLMDAKSSTCWGTRRRENGHCHSPRWTESYWYIFQIEVILSRCVCHSKHTAAP